MMTNKALTVLIPGGSTYVPLMPGRHGAVLMVSQRAPRHGAGAHLRTVPGVIKPRCRLGLPGGN